MLRYEVRVEGVVQGVGFRPFVYGLARELALVGSVANDSRGVILEVQGADGALARFLERLRSDVPPLAVIERIAHREIPARGDETAFVIAPSERGAPRSTLVSPDVATCDDCLREIFDPADRRYHYAFTNCTRCGPRFTIVRDVPYDRPNTTMAAFPRCEACRREYEDPLDRRFHAQPLACPACGPRLVLRDASGRDLPGDPMEAAAELLQAGRIVAVKGLGGYHLACDAANEDAVAALRARKHREEKPFAVMAADLEAARALVAVDEAEEALLTSRERPIVLLRRRPDCPVAPSVAPGNAFLGVMLPYTPLHHLLLKVTNMGTDTNSVRIGVGPHVLVMTSGNVSDEPIAYRDDEAFARLGGIADAFLAHDREIHVRTDDSVFRVFRHAPVPVRRARGYVPHPVRLPHALERPLLAVGAELKNTVCVARGAYAFVSHHLGDLENYEAYRSFLEAIEHFQRLFDVAPEAVAHDLHPEYLSTKWALAQDRLEPVGVQHHHAHIASCLADAGRDAPVVGVAFDGLGYGPDGTLWGGEFLIADARDFERIGHLETVPMPGGASAIRQPWRMAASWLLRSGAGDEPGLAVRDRHAEQWDAVLSLSQSGRAPLTSSAGRLFDAVSALLGIRDAVTYEGQAAIEMEQRADPDAAGTFPASLRDGPCFQIQGSDIVRAVVEELTRGTAPATIAGRFHHAMADLVLNGCRASRERSGLRTVALSGGVFQNRLLLERATARLEADGFEVLRHRQVPCNDGGICLGQIAVAARRL